MPEYPYKVGEDPLIARSDFDERVDIIPVSDPTPQLCTADYATTGRYANSMLRHLNCMTLESCIGLS